MRAALLLLGLPALAQIPERARELHADSLVFDAHVHVINRQLYDGTNIGDRLEDGQVDLPRAKEGGVKAMFFTLFVNEEYYPAHYETKHALRLIDKALEQIKANPSKIGLALNGADIRKLNQQGKIAAVLDLEGGYDMDGDLGLLRNLHRLGLRSMQLVAHNWTNNFADSCCAPPKWNGINDKGRAVIAEMNRLGMVINISHASDLTLQQTIDASRHPIIATHHGLRAFNDIPRTMPDHLLKKLAAKGGVIGFHIGNEFHNRKLFDYRTKQAGKPFWDTQAIGKKESEMTIGELDKLLAPRFPMVGIDAPAELKMSVDDWVGVVNYAINIAGEDHVALGSDFDGGPTPPTGIRDIRDLSMITDSMLRRGYSEARIRKFLGGNLMRVFERVTKP